jgi:hypothetical protein
MTSLDRKKGRFPKAPGNEIEYVPLPEQKT